MADAGAPPARLLRADLAKMTGSLLALAICLASVGLAPLIAGPELDAGGLFAFVQAEADAAYPGSDCALVASIAAACDNVTADGSAVCNVVRAERVRYARASSTCMQSHASWGVTCIITSAEQYTCLRLHGGAEARRVWCAYDAVAVAACWRAHAHAAVADAFRGCAQCPLVPPG